MGEASYPWPVPIWFCDYCDRVIAVGPKPVRHCGANSMSSVEAAPAFHWDDVEAGNIDD